MNINHIANKIEAKDRSLSELLFKKKYEIEYFQREYRWERRHIEELISDLSGSFLSNYNEKHTLTDVDEYNRYYLGPIVVYKKGASFSIVDGQQRLTSLTILIIFLNHLQNQIITDEDHREDLELYLFYKKGRVKKLTLDVEARSKAIHHLYRHFNTPFELVKEKQDEIDVESVNNILERYEDIKSLFPEEIRQAAVLPLFIEWLLQRIVMVEITAFSNQNAYSIFETMNDRGLNLTPTEMLKSYLLAHAEEEENIKELNLLWKDIILSLKTEYGVDSDQDFFKAWLRSKYAEKIRKTKSGAENEDFENIGTRFHTWVRENEKKLGLKNSQDYYLLVKSDIEFFSTIYLNVSKHQNYWHGSTEQVYLSSFYKIADSLSFPLYLAPITKLDDLELQIKKTNLVSWFIDNYTTSRTILGKSITQSSIRNAMYELIKSIRNADLTDLKKALLEELQKNANSSKDVFATLQTMNNWGYYHYFFARIMYFFLKKEKLIDEVPDFFHLMRSKKQRSLVLYRFIIEGEIDEGIEPSIWEHFANSVAAYCLVKRNEIAKIDGMKLNTRVNWLIKNGYMPEMEKKKINLEKNHITEFISMRSTKLEEVFTKIWQF